MEGPFASIIIPCYNAERYIGEAIQSALDQTYPHKEVIVIDDGSTDGSLDVVRSFGDRVRWETGPNRGGCPARNCGLQLAQGEFIQFLDADDLLHPTKVERQLAVYRQSDADLVFCDGRVLPTGDPVERMYQRDFDGQDPVLFMLGGILQTSAPLHRKSHLLEVGGFREDLPCAQDFDLHLRLACRGLRFRRLPEVLFTVRRNQDSVSSDYSWVLRQHGNVLKRAYEKLKATGELTEERTRAFAARLARDARHCLKYGLNTTAEKYFTLAQTMHWSGGLDRAYRRPARILRRTLGAVATERIVSAKRNLFQRNRRRATATRYLDREQPLAISPELARKCRPVVYLVHHELLSSIFESMILRPMSVLRAAGVPLHLCLVVRLGELVRPSLRRRLHERLRTARERFGGPVSVVVSPPTRFDTLWSTENQLYRLLERHYPNGEQLIVHARGPDAAQLALEVRNRRGNVKVIYNMEGATHAEKAYEYGYPDYATEPKELIERLEAVFLTEQRAARESDVLTCLSENMRDYAVARLGANAAQTELVWCHVPTEMYKRREEVRSTMRARLNISNRFVVCYCGSVYRRQRVPQGLALFRQILKLRPDAHLLALTQQPERMHELLAERHLEQCSKVLSVGHYDTPEYLSAADVGLITTGLFEPPCLANHVCCPTKFGEYLAAGVPVIMSEQIGDCSDLARSERVGLVLKNDARESTIEASIVEFLTDYCSDPRAWRSRCRHVAREHLDSKVHLQRVAGVYHKLSKDGHLALT